MSELRRSLQSLANIAILRADKSSQYELFSSQSGARSACHRLMPQANHYIIVVPVIYLKHEEGPESLIRASFSPVIFGEST